LYNKPNGGWATNIDVYCTVSGDRVTSGYLCHHFQWNSRHNNPLQAVQQQQEKPASFGLDS
jgi:hypothetical protein